MSDLLTPLIDAYRAENSPASLDARALRARILVASARRHHNPLRRLRLLLLPIAAAFVATASLAATPATRPALVRVLSQLASAFRASPAPSTPRPRPTPAARAIPDSATQLPTLSPHPDLPRDPIPAAPPLPSPAPVPSPFMQQTAGFGLQSSEASHPPALPAAPFTSTSTSASRSSSASPSSPASGSASSPASPARSLPTDLSPDLSAYGVAHRLHFESADYARALTAWNGYLARFPTGTFAPEARLNRAVCLARLGRTAEARNALTAIAQGTYGPYGREQAQRLLDALSPVR